MLSYRRTLPSMLSCRAFFRHSALARPNLPQYKHSVGPCVSLALRILALALDLSILGLACVADKSVGTRSVRQPRAQAMTCTSTSILAPCGLPCSRHECEAECERLPRLIALFRLVEVSEASPFFGCDFYVLCVRPPCHSHSRTEKHSTNSFDTTRTEQKHLYLQQNRPAWPRAGALLRIPPCPEALANSRCETVDLSIAAAHPPRQVVERRRPRSVHRSFPKNTCVVQFRTLRHFPP